MYFDLTTNKIKDVNQFELVNFLNTRAIDFYKGKCSFKSNDYAQNFKSTLSMALIHIERVFRAVFGSDIKLKNKDLSLFQKMFPNACKMFNVLSCNDIKRVGDMLDNIRNINAHQLLSQSDYKVLLEKIPFLKDQKKLNLSIKYFDESVTLAGIIFIVLNFVRGETIKQLCKQNVIFSLVAMGSLSSTDYNTFVEKISNVNLEVPIRQEKGTGVRDAVIGEWEKHVQKASGKETILIGFEKYPTVLVSYKIADNALCIYQNSLTKVYYSKTYVLAIEDKENFIRLSNELPPFTLIDYCYSIGAEVFDKKLANRLDQKFNLISKLNYPKFYTNKNIKTLLLPETISNYTINSDVISSGIMKVCLYIENLIYKNHSNSVFVNNDHYSTLKEAMLLENAPFELASDINYIRNFAVHGYILGDSLVHRGERKEFTLEYVVSTLRKLLDFFKRSSHENEIVGIIKKEFVGKLISANYKLVCKSSRLLLNGSDQYDAEKFGKECGAVKNGWLDLKKLNDLIVDGDYSFGIVKITIDGEDNPLYINQSKKDMDDLNSYLNKNHLKIIDEVKNGLYIELTVK